VKKFIFSVAFIFLLWYFAFVLLKRKYLIAGPALQVG